MTSSRAKKISNKITEEIMYRTEKLNQDIEHINYLTTMCALIEGVPLNNLADAEKKSIAEARGWTSVDDCLPVVEYCFTDCFGFKRDSVTGEYLEKGGELVGEDVYACYQSDPVLVYGCLKEPDIYNEQKMIITSAVYIEWPSYDDDGNVIKTEKGWYDSLTQDLELVVKYWKLLPEAPEVEDGQQ